MTLTETVKAFRTGTKLIIIGTVVLLVGRVFMEIASISPTAQLTPTPTPPAQFGKLPRLEIDSLELDSSSSPTFILDLISSYLPKGPTIASVYPIAQPQVSFLAEEKAAQRAKTFNFKTTPDINNTHFVWQDNLRTLEIEKKTLNLSYKYNYQNQSQIFIPGTFFSTDSVIKIAETILKKHNLFANLDGSKPKSQLLKLEGANLRETINLNEASAARVDFPVPLIDAYPVVNENPTQDLVYVIFTGDPQNRNSYGEVIDLQSIRWLIQTKEGGIYTLKESQQAWDELKNTTKSLVHLLPAGQDPTLPYNPPRVKEFRAQEAFLAYYITAPYQKYLQPVWVFKGTATLIGYQQADWQAYIPALAPELIAP
ncbi:hypothetical protein KJ596_00725 [Patescibacteria group bacterium]|nr:hypothetical protein [Patescibacteria group bacterium]MBU1868485.1 hypothetical protein [Patescibacteria group bacterium]